MIVESSMFMFINIAITLIIVICIIVGYTKGLVYEILSLCSFIVSLLLAYIFSPVLATHLVLFNPGDDIALNLIGGLINHIIWFILILLIVKIIFSIILLFASFLTKIPLIGPVNKFFGAFIGAFNGFIWVLIISLILSTPLIENGKEVKDGTLIKYINDISNKVLVKISENVDFKDIENGLNSDEINDVRSVFEEWLIEYGVNNE